MASGNGSIKHTIIASVTSVIILLLAAFVYVYFSQPTQPGNVTVSPQPVGSKQVVAIGDIVCSPVASYPPGSCQHEATANITQQLKPDAVLLLGDLQYESGRLIDFQNAFDKSWGKFKDISYPVPGNHEYATKDAAGYFDYFGQKAGDRDKGYYSLNLGAWHLIALNSNCSEVGGCDEASPQGQWLKADLAGSDTVCSLAFWHHPPFSSGKYNGKPDLQLGQQLWQQVQGRVDMVLNGHDHLYERFSPQNNTTQFIVGTGGKNFYQKTATSQNSQKIIDNTFGVLSLSLNTDTFSWKFIGVSGEVLDQSEQACTK